jgi:hypothetical protein
VEIRTCDLRFIRHGSQPIEVPLEDGMKQLLVFLKGLGLFIISL